MDEIIDRVAYGQVVTVSGSVSEDIVKTKLASIIADMARLAVRKLMDVNGCWVQIHDKGLDVVEFALRLSIDCGRSLFPEPYEEDEDE